jgi:hypothetical protein
VREVEVARWSGLLEGATIAGEVLLLLLAVVMIVVVRGGGEVAVLMERVRVSCKSK